MKRSKIWLIPVAIFLVLVILAAVFWQTLMVYLAPKTVLASALTDTISSLEARFSSGPAAVLLRGLSPDGKNTIDLQLNTTNELLGSIRYDMNVQMEQTPRRILAQGQAQFQGKEMDLSVYLDGDFAALSSASLLQGKFYGLTYDTFSQDIQNSPILRLLISADTIGQWEESVAKLKETMNKSVSIPDFSQVDSKSLILGIMALDADVEKESVRINGADLECFEISFETTGAQVLDGLRYLDTELPVNLTRDSEISVSFYLHKDVLRKIKLTIESEALETEIDLLLGQYDIFLLIRDALGFREIGIHSEYDASTYRESIALKQSRSNISSEQLIEYTWNRNTGDTQLAVTTETDTKELALNLQKGENGFLLKTDDFEGLMHILTGAEDKANSPCTMTVTRGAEVITPEYKNFADWSMEDMVTLLTGIGGLLGLKLP